MNLRNTMIEKAEREIFSRNRISPGDEGRCGGFHEALFESFPSLQAAYMLGHIPDQDADFYKILVDGEVIVSLELPKDEADGPPKLKTVDMNEYERSLSKMGRIRLAVARDMSAADMRTGRR